MILNTFSHFPDFELLDSGRGYRLERWGAFKLARPDPQAIWQPHLPNSEWAKADAKFDGRWMEKHQIAQPWIVKWPLPLKPGEAKTGDWNLKLYARLTAFKHTGIFAEQAANWEWLASFPPLVRGGLGRGSGTPTTNDQRPRILNLFGYTGAATVLLAKLGCFVTHVDASKPAIAWAKENQVLNQLPEDSIRWILDDAAKFVKRELKRGVKYDGILMDPPAFGHSPTGKTWKFNEDFPKLLADCVELLSPRNSFLLVNAYATNASALSLQNVMEDILPKTGNLETGELCLKQANGRLISTGIVARWSR